MTMAVAAATVMSSARSPRRSGRRRNSRGPRSTLDHSPSPRAVRVRGSRAAATSQAEPRKASAAATKTAFTPSTSSSAPASSGPSVLSSSEAMRERESEVV